MSSEADVNGDIAQMLQCISVRNVDREVWASVVLTFSDYSYEQTFDYANLMAARAGASALFLTVHAGKHLLAAASVRLKTFPLIGRGLAYISGGPLMQICGRVWDAVQNYAVLEALKKKLVEEDGHLLCLRLPISPPAPEPEARAVLAKLGFQATNRVRTYRTIVSDLKQDDLRRSLEKKWRRELKFAEKANLIIERGSTESLCNRFLELFDQMRQFKDFSVGLNPRVFFSLPPGSLGLEVLIATNDGQDVAGHVLSVLGDTAVTLFSATNELGRATKAGYLLFWSAMLLGRERGLGWCDSGGIDARGNPGVYHFKKGMGGQELVAVGPFEARPTGMLPILMDKLFTLSTRLRT